jgi:hypothetical protein
MSLVSSKGLPAMIAIIAGSLPDIAGIFGRHRRGDPATSSPPAGAGPHIRYAPEG